MPELSGIVGERVAFTDPKTGVIVKPWFRFLHNLFELTGSGQSVLNLADLTADVEELQMAPPVIMPSNLTLVGRVVATLNFASTAANSSSTLTVTVPDAADGDIVSLGVPAASVPTNGHFFAWVSAANTVSVRFCNNTTAAIDPASGVFRIAVTRG